MKKREKLYQCCGKIVLTFSQAEKCNECKAKERYTEGRNKVVVQLEKLGHTNVKIDGLNYYGKTSISFLHPICGTQQNWAIINLQDRLKKAPNIAPCSKCGGKARMAKALKAYKEKYGLDESQIAEWETYRKLTRRFTAQNYKKFKDEINPSDVDRGIKSNHLDHKVPIIYGFKNGLSPAHIARKENLQMLPAKENLIKARKTFIL